MDRPVIAKTLTAEAFAPFGDVLEGTGEPSMMINQGRCARFHDLARLDFGGGSAGVSLFRSEAVDLPYDLALMERHPLGSQAFIPLSGRPFLVTVAPDRNGAPGEVHAFLTSTAHGVNILRNVWHGVLTPLTDPAEFIVVDRIAPDGETPGANLEEHAFNSPITIVTD